MPNFICDIPQIETIIKSAIAKMCNTTSDRLDTTLSTNTIHDRINYMGQRGWDEAGFLLALEELGFTVDSDSLKFPLFLNIKFFFYRSSHPKSTHDWIQKAAQALAGRIETTK